MYRRHTALLIWLLAGAVLRPGLAAAPATPADYSAVEALFTEYCLDCHGAQDPEGKLVLESFDLLMTGGEGGPAIVPATSGVIRWGRGGGELVRLYEGHKDAVYAVALSSDGKTLATGSYDQKIKLWNVVTGAE